MSELVRQKVVFPLSAIRVVVFRNTVDKSIQENGVHGHSPVAGGREVVMFIPLPPIVQRILGRSVLIEVELDLLLIVWKASSLVDDWKQVQ